MILRGSQRPRFLVELARTSNAHPEMRGWYPHPYVGRPTIHCVNWLHSAVPAGDGFGTDISCAVCIAMEDRLAGYTSKDTPPRAGLMPVTTGTTGARGVCLVNLVHCDTQTPGFVGEIAHKLPVRPLAELLILVSSLANTVRNIPDIANGELADTLRVKPAQQLGAGRMENMPLLAVELGGRPRFCRLELLPPARSFRAAVTFASQCRVPFIAEALDRPKIPSVDDQTSACIRDSSGNIDFAKIDPGRQAGLTDDGVRCVFDRKRELVVVRTPQQFDFADGPLMVARRKWQDEIRLSATIWQDKRSTSTPHRLIFPTHGLVGLIFIRVRRLDRNTVRQLLMPQCSCGIHIGDQLLCQGLNALAVQSVDTTLGHVLQVGFRQPIATRALGDVGAYHSGPAPSCFSPQALTRHQLVA